MKHYNKLQLQLQFFQYNGFQNIFYKYLFCNSCPICNNYLITFRKHIISLSPIIRIDSWGRKI